MSFVQASNYKTFWKKGENLQDQAHSRYLRNSCWKNKWRNMRGPLWRKPARKACRQQFSPFVQKILGLLAPGWRFIPPQEPLAFLPPCMWQLFNSAAAYFCHPSFCQLMGSMSCTMEFIPPRWSGTRQEHAWRPGWFPRGGTPHQWGPHERTPRSIPGRKTADAVLP